MTPVVVDTSVWCRFFAGARGYRKLGDLLEERGAVLRHSFVLGELVLGGLRETEEKLLGRLPEAVSVPDAEVLQFVRRRKLARRGIGWVDVHLLASALNAGAVLWSADGDLRAAAADLGVAFVHDLGFD